MMMKKRIIQISSLLFMTCFVAACSNLPGLQRTVISQGNQVPETRLAQIKPGMSEGEVQRILGTPLVRDAYHPNIWHYTYLTTLSTGEKTAHENVKITFDSNKKVQSVEKIQ